MTKQLNTKQGFDPLGDVLKPVGSSGAIPSTGSIQATQPQIIPGAAQQQHPGKVLTGDLDSSLASLAENLTINKSASSSMKWVSLILLLVIAVGFFFWWHCDARILNEEQFLTSNLFLQRRPMEFSEESSKTTKLVTAADGDNNWRKLSPHGKEIFLIKTF